MKTLFRPLAAMLLSVAIIFGTAIPAFAQQGNAVPSPTRSGGKFYAASYGKWVVHTTTSTAAGAATINVDSGAPTAGSLGVVSDSGRFLNPFQNSFLIGGGGFISVNVDAGAANEVVVLTGASGCGSPNANLATGQLSTCALTAASFTNAHGQGAFVTSGTAGLQEAINDAAASGGGIVAVDSSWTSLGGTTAMLAAAVVANNVSIEDDRNLGVHYWNPMGGATALAAPTQLTALTALPTQTPVGAFGNASYNVTIAYVDLLGQEGSNSTTFVDATGLATSSFIFSPPAASPGAVGYTIYIGLSGAGSATLQYKVPLITQPTVVGAAPVSNGVCTLTTIETVTPACAVKNTAYGQLTGATATVSAITVSSSPIQPTVTTTSTTAIYVPNPGGRTTAFYAPGAQLGTLGTVTSTLPFTIGAAAATVVPNVAATINIAPQFMNVLGKTLEICGELSSTASAATIVDIQFQWDSLAQNTAGKGVLIGDLTATPAAAIATAGKASFCADFQTTVTGAAVQGGTINHVGASGAVGGLTVIAPGAFADAMPAGAVGSLNLAADARINIIYLHTTASDGAGWIMQNVTTRLR